ncbi:hypothetical protein TNCV_4327461 [Trichonephila clavipes]|nr:hypothetical protein TNCV_4327461 [Trichonephila clavipes]
MQKLWSGDRGRVAIYRPFGEFRRAKIVLSPVWCSRPTTGVPLAHATMNFVGLDLTTSDRLHRESFHKLNNVIHGSTYQCPAECLTNSHVLDFIHIKLSFKHKSITRKPLDMDLLGLQSSVNCQVIYSQFGLAIHQNDHQARRRFVEWAQNETAVVPDFHKRILFSDEAHFWLNGYVNKQNCRIWSEANPQVYVETPLHREKLTVWCDLWAVVIGIEP